MDTKNERILCGLSRIDLVTGGWQPSQLTVIAARPAVGKTSFALTAARNAILHQGVKVAFFSLELGEKQLEKRLRILCPEEAELDVVRANMLVDDTLSTTLDHIRSKMSCFVEQGTELVIFDYLQLIAGPKKLAGNRGEELSAVLCFLKDMAVNLNVPVLALSQLCRNRGSLMIYDPELSDFDMFDPCIYADNVIIINRPFLFSIAEDMKLGLGDVICKIWTKQYGSTHRVHLTFDSDNASFSEIPIKTIRQTLLEADKMQVTARLLLALKDEKKYMTDFACCLYGSLLDFCNGTDYVFTPGDDLNMAVPAQMRVNCTLFALDLDLGVPDYREQVNSWLDRNSSFPEESTDDAAAHEIVNLVMSRRNKMG